MIQFGLQFFSNNIVDIFNGYIYKQINLDLVDYA